MSGILGSPTIDFHKKPARKHYEGRDLPCGCCVDVTEEQGGHWWRFQILDRDFLCRKARRLKGQDQINHFALNYARQKEAQR